MAEGDDKPMDRECIARRLRRFGEVECTVQSPLYAVLARHAADDPFIVDLLVCRRAGQPPANILLGAVHLLLLEGGEHPLRDHFPDLVPGPLPPEEAGEKFSDFCRANVSSLAAVLLSRNVAINEVQRCACLVPAFAAGIAWLDGDNGAAHFIEVGSSAGLTLIWDRVGYDFGRGPAGGAAAAPLTLACTVEGPYPLPAAAPLPRALSRIGLDIEPLDLTHDDDVAWLRALIWPEQRERVVRFENAVALARAAPTPILRGNALDLLPGLLGGLPAGAPACVYHSFVMAQFDDAMRRDFAAILATASRDRDIIRVAFEHRGGDAAELTVGLYRQGGLIREGTVGEADPHGAWLRWRGG